MHWIWDVAAIQVIYWENVSMNKKLKVFHPSAKRSNFTEHCMNSHVVTKSHTTFSPEGKQYKFTFLKGAW